MSGRTSNRIRRNASGLSRCSSAANKARAQMRVFGTRRAVHAEAESQALRDWLDELIDTGWTSSTLLEIESFRALARYAPDAVTRLPAVLDLIDLVEPEPSVRILAQTIKPVTVRSLDAIHLATALRIRPRLTSFVTYDKRLAEAAAHAGLVVEMPT